MGENITEKNPGSQNTGSQNRISRHLTLDTQIEDWRLSCFPKANDSYSFMNFETQLREKIDKKYVLPKNQNGSFASIDKPFPTVLAAFAVPKTGVSLANLQTLLDSNQLKQRVQVDTESFRGIGRALRGSREDFSFDSILRLIETHLCDESKQLVPYFYGLISQKELLHVLQTGGPRSFGLRIRTGHQGLALTQVREASTAGKVEALERYIIMDERDCKLFNQDPDPDEKEKQEGPLSSPTHTAKTVVQLIQKLLNEKQLVFHERLCSYQSRLTRDTKIIG